MTKRQIAKQNMYLGIMMICLNNSLVWQLVQVFTAAFDLFKAKIKELDKAAERQESLKAGYTIAKRNNRVAMANATFIIKSAVQALASDTGNAGLFGELNYSYTKLIQGSAIGSRNRCQIVHDLAQANMVALQQYGVVQADNDQLKQLIANFSDMISKPKVLITQEKEATKAVKALMQEIDIILNNKLTKLMANFSKSAPTFYKEFILGKKIYNAKTNFTEIRATIINQNTGTLLEGVQMYAQGEDGQTYKVVSNDKGVADAKQIQPELYSLTFEIPGFESVNKSNVKAVVGKKENIVIEMKPLG